MGTENFFNELMENAARPVVFLYRQDPGRGVPYYGLGGQVEPLLHIESIAVRSGGAANTAQLSLSLQDWRTDTATGPQQIRPEYFGQYCNVDDLVEVAIPLTDTDGVTVEYWPIFVGFLQDPQIEIDACRERVLWTARGFDSRLEDIPASGQKVVSPTFEKTRLAGGGTPANVPKDTIAIDTALVFNPDGVGNMARDVAYVTTAFGEEVPVRLFERPGRRDVAAQSWTLYDAVTYLLWCYNDQKWVLNPSRYELSDLLQFTPMTNVDLRGCRNLRDALRRVLEGTKFSFYVSAAPLDWAASGWRVHPAGTDMMNVRCQLHFFERHAGQIVVLQMPRPGTAVTEAHGANTVDLLLKHRTAEAVNDVEVLGDFKTFQGVFSYDSAHRDLWHLLEAWEAATYPLSDYFNGSSFTPNDTWKDRHWTNGKDYQDYQDVYRSFALNEDGRYYASPMVYNNATAKDSPHAVCYDFTTLFGSSAYQVRPRRFHKPIEVPVGAQPDQRLEPLLKMSLDGGSNWFWHTQFAVAKDECKVTITTADLHTLKREDADGNKTGLSYIEALQQNQLVLKLYASIRSDHRISGRAAKLQTAASRFVKRFTVVDPKLRYQQLGGAGGGTVGDQQDHRISTASSLQTFDASAACVTRAEEMRQTVQDGQMVARPRLLGLNFQFAIGQRLDRIAGREISLRMTRDTVSDRYPQIFGIVWTFRGGSRPRHATVLELDERSL